jgi:hypothetical protein
LILPARVDDDWFFHRSFDHGVTWRPLRTGVIGVEGSGALVRCITERGGIEAGRPPLPMNWSWDGGHAWRLAPYDATALRAARTLVENPSAGETPHCASGPGRLIQCVDNGRARLIRERGGASQEIPGPSTCEYVRQVDERRTVAFGPSCGFFLSGDRGGVWRRVTQSLEPDRGANYAEGHGGFVNAHTAWRLDGGIWWTFDSGEHWRPFFSVGERMLERGVFVDPRNGVFATNTGWVVATRDGGRTFTYVLRGEVERIASSGRAVLVTTAQSMRVSPDGGVTWLASGAAAPSTPLDPSVDIVGRGRAVALPGGVRVTQNGDRLVIDRHGREEEIAHDLPSTFGLLAVHVAGSSVDRVLLERGAVLAHEAPSGP